MTPPIPWQAKTSSVSSTPDLDFTYTTACETMAEKAPMKRLAPTETKPAAGVMATRPTTAPIQAPIAEGLRPRTISKKIQDKAPAAEAVLVVASARAACSLA